jgi:hypothetical protein
MFRKQSRLVLRALGAASTLENDVLTSS